ncbi:MAG: DUF1738 domain-containing protein, partial [Deltaproteobacteria bacterium]|nr:DUF1738 domain-containing protein [Deltaproteobacteria bacterium]
TVFDVINNTIFKKLESGVIPWKMPWHNLHKPACNLISQKPYRGINYIILNMLGFKHPYFLTYKQAVSLGGSVKKGEHGFPIVFWKYIEKEGGDCILNEAHEKSIYHLLRYYTVFNVEQCDNINIDHLKTDEFKREFSPIEAAQKIVDNMPNKPVIEHKENRAFYLPSKDLVNMPSRELFFSDERYYSTLFHEMGHATGAKTRLNRPTLTKEFSYNRHEYSKEELIAEFCASYLSAEAGIDGATIDNSAAYIAGWLKVLQNNKTWLIFAAAQAQRAADYILGKDSN